MGHFTIKCVNNFPCLFHTLFFHLINCIWFGTYFRRWYKSSVVSFVKLFSKNYLVFLLLLLSLLEIFIDEQSWGLRLKVLFFYRERSGSFLIVCRVRYWGLKIINSTLLLIRRLILIKVLFLLIISLFTILIF